MAFNAVTTKKDLRARSPEFPVWETITVFSIKPGDGSAELTEEVEINGILKDLRIVVGTAEGITGTVDIDFDDAYGNEFDDNAGLTEGSTTVPSEIDQYVNNFNIRCTPSDDPTPTNTWTITVYAKGI